MEYGLIGAKLTHSFSKLLHQEYLKTDYELKELSLEELDIFMSKKEFKGINVTIPYKTEVMKYLDYVDPTCLKIGACNCIINENGMLKGYNTDYFGFKYLLIKNKVDVKDKKCFILGSGGTFNTVKTVLLDLGAKSVTCVSRVRGDNKINYEDLEKEDVDILVNTSPCGMYPHNDECLIDFKKIKVKEAVVDVIFNPLNTKLLVEAKKQGLKTVGGLEMLVAQGVFASEYFLNKTYENELIHKIYLDILKEKKNIVLIGMPMSGKSTLGKMLEKHISKKYIDIDREIIEDEKMSINEIFELKGEAYFRQKESLMYQKFAKENGLIISCGGGVIKNFENIDALRQNGVIIFVDRMIEKMISNSSRPLARSKEDVYRLYNERIELYHKASDAIITNNGSKKKAAIKIVEAFYANINY